MTESSECKGLIHLTSRRIDVDKRVDYMTQLRCVDISNSEIARIYVLTFS